jgi:hypothetical protein
VLEFWLGEVALHRRPYVRAFQIALVLLLVSTAASAQWVMVGRKVIGRISSLTQPRDAKTPGYDAATVVLDADAQKVYGKAVDLLQKNPSITITERDDAHLDVAFKQGDWAAEMRVTELGEKLSQILIVSGAAPGEPSGTSVVVDAVKRVCDGLGVQYTLDPP